jgi:hypothetical protein
VSFRNKKKKKRKNTDVTLEVVLIARDSGIVGSSFVCRPHL